MQIEQAIARGESTSQIMRRCGATYEQIQDVRGWLELVHAHVDEPTPLEADHARRQEILAAECVAHWGSWLELERERRVVQRAAWAAAETHRPQPCAQATLPVRARRPETHHMQAGAA